ncbi:MAG: hypothetical protein JSS62_05195 [Verrucomicrobia bacterium]|nr:hypothetical protein [Verrucomicrobiota bacterium]MBS0647456.1 hypothetical protein [Verrucomicrobiota bacterium]
MKFEVVKDLAGDKFRLLTGVKRTSFDRMAEILKQSDRDKKSQGIICTAFSNGKRHDFRLFKDSKTCIHPAITVVVDTGYMGLQKIHAKTQMPKKRG